MGATRNEKGRYGGGGDNDDGVEEEEEEAAAVLDAIAANIVAASCLRCSARMQMFSARR